MGFIAAALLTVVGFVLYALFSFLRRMIEFGVLRAIGLRTKQMIVLLSWELASLILIGMAAGTGLGVGVSAWFIPYLQIGIEISSRYGDSELHVLGYFLDWHDPELNARLTTLRESRHRRNPLIIERLQSLASTSPMTKSARSPAATRWADPTSPGC